MSVPMSHATFLKILKAEGLTVHQVDNWTTHTRTGSGRPWGDVFGVMIHHTVTSGTPGSVAICRTGYSSLPGPLCHGVIDKKGEVWLVGYGRTNHAGGGDPAVLAAVKAESYTTRPPAPKRGNADGVDGNRAFYGFECINLGSGSDPWPEAQLSAIEKVSTAICRHHGWTEKSAIGHKEWSNDKVDPRGFTMESMRARIKARLKPKPPAPVKKYHTVVDGDTLWRISQQRKVTVEKLRSLNPGIKGDVIKPGDKVRYA